MRQLTALFLFIIFMLLNTRAEAQWRRHYRHAHGCCYYNGEECGDTTVISDKRDRIPCSEQQYWHGRAYSRYMEDMYNCCDKDRNPKYNERRDEEKDSDNDGVPDDADKCPNEPGSKSNNGCPASPPPPPPSVGATPDMETIDISPVRDNPPVRPERPVHRKPRKPTKR